MRKITEAIARAAIAEGAAGYYEISLRDSISKSPIAHPERICVFADGGWYMLEKNELSVSDHGRIGNEDMNAAAHIITIERGHPIEALLARDIAEALKRQADRRSV
jgi:hypothetical protein